MNNSSKEWIKYLTLPIWCDSSKKYYYEFPPLQKNFFETEYVYEAFLILSTQDENTYKNYAEYQEDQEKKIRAYIKLYQDNKDKDKKIEELNEQIKELKKKLPKNSLTVEENEEKYKISKTKTYQKKYRKTTFH